MGGCSLPLGETEGHRSRRKAKHGEKKRVSRRLNPLERGRDRGTSAIAREEARQEFNLTVT